MRRVYCKRRGRNALPEFGLKLWAVGLYRGSLRFQTIPPKIWQLILCGMQKMRMACKILHTTRGQGSGMLTFVYRGNSLRAGERSGRRLFFVHPSLFSAGVGFNFHFGQFHAAERAIERGKV